MEGDKYTLDADGNPVPEPDLMKWSAWFDTADRTIERTHVGQAQVVTEFLGRDYGTGDGPPVLYETTVLNIPLDWEPQRFATLEAARQGHARMVERVRAKLPRGGARHAARVSPPATPRVLSRAEVEALARQEGQGPAVLSLIATVRHAHATLHRIAERQFDTSSDVEERDQMAAAARQALRETDADGSPR